MGPCPGWGLGAVRLSPFPRGFPGPHWPPLGSGLWDTPLLPMAGATSAEPQVGWAKSRGTTLLGGACAQPAGLPDRGGAWLTAAWPQCPCPRGGPSVPLPRCPAGRSGPFPVCRLVASSGAAASSRARLAAPSAPPQPAFWRQAASPLLPGLSRLTGPCPPCSRPRGLPLLPRSAPGSCLCPAVTSPGARRSGCSWAAPSTRCPPAAVHIGGGWREGPAPRGGCSADKGRAPPSACWFSKGLGLAPQAWPPCGAGPSQAGVGGSGLPPEGLHFMAPTVPPPVGPFVLPAAHSPDAGTGGSTGRPGAPRASCRGLGSDPEALHVGWPRGRPAGSLATRAGPGGCTPRPTSCREARSSAALSWGRRVFPVAGAGGPWGAFAAAACPGALTLGFGRSFKEVTLFSPRSWLALPSAASRGRVDSGDDRGPLCLPCSCRGLLSAEARPSGFILPLAGDAGHVGMSVWCSLLGASGTGAC